MNIPYRTKETNGYGKEIDAIGCILLECAMCIFSWIFLNCGHRLTKSLCSSVLQVIFKCQHIPAESSSLNRKALCSRVLMLKNIHYGMSCWTDKQRYHALPKVKIKHWKFILKKKIINNNYHHNWANSDDVQPIFFIFFFSRSSGAKLSVSFMLKRR